MVQCFLCGFVFDDFKYLKHHFDFMHSDYNFLNYKCVEGDCNRSYQLLSSFKRHTLREHASKSVPILNDNIDIGNIIHSHSSNTSPVPLEGNSLENPLMSYTETDAVSKALSVFIASLYGNVILPRNTIQKVVKGLNEFVCSLVPAITNCVNTTQSNNNIEELLQLPLKTFTTEHKRMLYFKNIGTYIEPAEIVIGQRLDRVKRKHLSSIQPVECKEHFIPLRKVLKNFFSLEGLLSDTLQYMHYLNNNRETVVNFIQGSFWKSRLIQNSNRIVIPLFMYFDDYEIGNVLGSHAGVHKLGAVYFSVPCLPPWRASVLSNIFLGLLFHSSDRTSFGNNIIFQPVIEELNYLSKTGIHYDLPSLRVTVFFELALLLGDNLGLHSMIGFTESFSANYSCRVCKVTKEMLKVQCYEDKLLLRDTENYVADLNLNNVSLSGIKEKCVWLNVEGFDLFQQVGVDMMHDVLEGVGKYILNYILTQCTQKSKIFSLSLFNQMLLAFDYGQDSANKPCPVEKESLLRNNMRQSSAEMLSLLRYFGLIVGDLVPRDDNVWYMYTHLRKVLDIFLSLNIAHGTADLLQVLVAELNEIYINVTKDTLKPKFHNLVHYHTALKNFGPLSSLWSMRFEAKHRNSKMSARSSCNRVNVTLTLAIKHQLQLNEVFLRGKLADVLSTGPKQSVTSNEIDNIILLLSLECEKSIVRVSWARMSSLHYEKGTVLVTEVCNDNYLYRFLLVDKIFIYNSNRIIFSGEVLESLEFDEHYYAYKVFMPSVARHVIFFESLLSPIPNHINVLRNGEQCVVLRSSL